MKLQKQVTSVEVSNKIHNLGIQKPSIFYREWQGAEENEIEMWDDSEGDFCVDNVACYTVAELGEMLPEDIYVDGVNYQLQFTNGIHSVGYQGEIDVSVFKVIHESIGLTEADARAKMLIYLLENKLITI